MKISILKVCDLPTSPLECGLLQCGQMATEDLACRVVGSIPVGVSSKVCGEILGQMAERFKAAVY